MQDPSASHSLPRLGCLWGTFSPSRRQIRSTRLSLTIQPACPPPIIGDLAHADLADCVGDMLALRDQHIDLPQLRDNFLGSVLLPRHIGPP